jgi:hypothetical protein
VQYRYCKADSINDLYRGPGFLPIDMNWLPALPHPSVSLKETRRLEKEREVADRRGGGRGAKSYDRKKAWSAIQVNHSILSVAE